MRKPRLLDLFCGAGGAGMGYHLAGFDVVGVDLKPQPDYPFLFIQGDAVEFIKRNGKHFDAIHASPPCQKFTTLKTVWNHRDDHPDLVGPMRELLTASGKPWIMENVHGAPFSHSVRLCGTAFGLGVEAYDGWRELRRHRLFESNCGLMGAMCQHKANGTIGIYGDHARDRRRKPGVRDRGIDFPDEQKMELGKAAMVMPWITKWRGLSEAIPPAYTEYLGEQLLRAVEIAA